MKYLDGRDILLGDHVDLGGGMSGTVVCCFDEGQFAPDFHKDEWAGLQKGVMVKSEQAGLIHYPEPDVDLVLVRRASQ